jgi:hypothetical protein
MLIRSIEPAESSIRLTGAETVSTQAPAGPGVAAADCGPAVGGAMTLPFLGLGDPGCTSIEERIPMASTSMTTAVTATTVSNCHPAYKSPCLPNVAGDAMNCWDGSTGVKGPVYLVDAAVDPFKLDEGGKSGVGCES